MACYILYYLIIYFSELRSVYNVLKCFPDWRSVILKIDLLSRRARMEMLAALKARREALESKMKEKKRLLKELCIKEG
jgi:hypothetical protein